MTLIKVIKKNKKIKGLFLTILFIILTIQSFNKETLVQKTTNVNEQENLKTSQLGVIHIDGNDPLNNWTAFQLHNPWCLGSGTPIDPYVINERIINGQGHRYGIYIINTDEYFRIENCTVYNSGINGQANAGIFLNTLNGEVIHNKIYQNDACGIYLWDNGHNNITGNLIYDNNKWIDGIGIYLRISDYNNVIGNSILNHNNLDISGGGPHNDIKWNNINGICESITFDDAGTGDLTWDQAINILAWCNGSGTSNNPYLIKEMTFDASNMETCLTINNSTKFFKIEYCEFQNSGTNSLNGGIKLYNTENGYLLNNKITTNIQEGIILIDSRNNTLDINTIKNAKDNGILLLKSPNNTITKNIISNNLKNGVNAIESENNSIYENQIKTNINGILLTNSSNNNKFLDNNISSNTNYGISVNYSCSNNLFSNNTFKNNGINAFDNGSLNYWDNGTLGNFWDDYLGEDLDDDGIGDTPYYIDGELGNYDYFPIWWDNPVITIITPNQYQLFGNNTISYELSIINGMINSTWYSLNYGLNYTANDITGIINQTAWDACANGTVTIKFFVNDSLGNIGSEGVSIYKDSIPPDIIINSPYQNQLFGNSSANFHITVNEGNLNCTWYTLNGGKPNFFTNLNGNINHTAWEECGNGTVLIRFFANDSVGNIAFTDIEVKKDCEAPQITILSPLPYQLFGSEALNFSLTIAEGNLNNTWYTLNGSSTYFFSGMHGTINEIAWETYDNGTVTICFFANDTVGNLAYSSVTIRKKIVGPVINIDLPLNDDIFGAEAPYFSVQIKDNNLSMMWYSFDNGITNIVFTENGTIDQTLWNSLQLGILSLRFYANDSLGNTVYKEVSIIKDNYPPVMNVISPINYGLFGRLPPAFNIRISENFLDKMWYTLDGGNTNITFNANGTINQNVWNNCANGTVQITFYANDTLGNIASSKIIVRKDIISPIIIIHQPILNQEFKSLPPAFEITVNEPNPDTIWYTVDSGVTNYTISELVGTIDEIAWKNLPNGLISIRFYSKDKVGNIGYKDIIVVKNASINNNPNIISGYNISTLIILFSTFSLIMIKRIKKKKYKVQCLN